MTYFIASSSSLSDGFAVGRTARPEIDSPAPETSWPAVDVAARAGDPLTLAGRDDRRRQRRRGADPWNRSARITLSGMMLDSTVIRSIRETQRVAWKG
jgi:hypothetical protein